MIETAWFYSFEAVSIEKSLQKKLKQEQVILQPFKGASTGPGLVITNSVTPAVCDFLHQVTGEGTRRVLVIATVSRELDNGGAWKLLDAGASDVLALNELSEPAAFIAARFYRWAEIDRVVNSALVRKNLVGHSRVWRVVLQRLVEAACFTDAPVLLCGETGTGKELAARLIHTLDSERKENELVVLDCTTIVPELSGSELFGHERGAFTGAVASREGAFALADGGTLFLDEVGELPQQLQVQLLRALQEHTYKRVGSNVWRHSDFRLLCATNRELQVEEMNGRFRRDLYFRLASWTIGLPPLRQRLEDIPQLFKHFWQEAKPEHEPPALDSRVETYLMTRSYPGNVRDLRNLVLRIAARHVGPGPITIGDIPHDDRPAQDVRADNWCDNTVHQALRRALAANKPLREIRRTVDDAVIRLVVEDEGGNLQQAARRLDVSDRTLQKWRAARQSLPTAAAASPYPRNTSATSRPSQSSG